MKDRAPIFQPSTRERLLMLIINYTAFFHVLLVGVASMVPWGGWPWRLAAGVTVLYLLPPLLARIVRRLSSLDEGHIRTNSPSFFAWWMMFNLQVVFCRFPVLEEIIRLIPGAYSLWLRLWGAKIGRFTYWAAGTLILDRSYLKIGDGVVFGADVRINPHVLQRNQNGEMELILATVKIGDRALIGGYSLLTAGTEIAADECTRAFLISPPFSKWENGSRLEKGGNSA